MIMITHRKIAISDATSKNFNSFLLRSFQIHFLNEMSLILQTLNSFCIKGQFSNFAEHKNQLRCLLKEKQM